MKTSQTLPSLMLLVAVALLSATSPVEAAVRGVSREPRDEMQSRMLMGKDKTNGGKMGGGKSGKSDSDDGDDGGDRAGGGDAGKSGKDGGKNGKDGGKSGKDGGKNGKDGGKNGKDGGGDRAGGGVDDGTTTFAGTLIESQPCLPFYKRNEPWEVSDLYRSPIDNPVGISTVSCSTNTCGRVGNEGCCRFHTRALVCDSAATGFQLSNANAQPCICNQFTDNSHIADQSVIFGAPRPTSVPVTDNGGDRAGDSLVNGVAAARQCMVYDETSDFYDADLFGFPFAGLPQFKSCTSNAFCQNQGLGCCAAGVCYCSADRECIPEP